MHLRTLGLIAIAACGSAPPKLTIGPDHLSRTLGQGAPALSGTWHVESTMGNGSIELIPIRNQAFSTAVRKNEQGTVVARGIAVADGGKVYVAWSTDEHGTTSKDGVPEDFKLVVVSFKPNGWEAAWGPFPSAASGTIGSTKLPAQLPAHQFVRYPGTYQLWGYNKAEHTELALDRTGDKRFYIGISTMVPDFGTAMLAGDKLVAAMMGDYGTPTGEVLGAGVYEVHGDSIDGEVGWMKTAQHDRPTSSDLPPFDEHWTRGVGAAKASAGPSGPPATEAQCGEMADHLVGMLVDSGELPKDQAPAVRTIVATHCTQDQWAKSAYDCVMSVKSMKENERCDHVLAPAQVQALEHDIGEQIDKKH